MRANKVLKFVQKENVEQALSMAMALIAPLQHVLNIAFKLAGSLKQKKKHNFPSLRD